MKACQAGCIGCGKCVKVCAFDAITVSNNVAYIDSYKCKLCRKCVNECPTGAIALLNMEPLPKAPKVAPAKADDAAKSAAKPAEVVKPVEAAKPATQPAVEVKKESVNEQK